jgi:hypothetical protein
MGPSKYRCRDGIELETVRFEKEIDHSTAPGGFE